MTASPTPVLHRPDRVYDGYVFDLDGTVYLGNALLPGAGEVIAAIRERGARTVFLSNNPTRDPQMYADKLGALGITTSVDDIVNPVVTVPRWLKDLPPERRCVRHREEPLKRALAAAGCGSPRTPKRSTSSSRATTAPSTTASCRSPSTRSGSTGGPA